MDSTVGSENSWITTDSTVDEVTANSLAARSILSGFNIDVCCGGPATIADASAKARVDPVVLLALLAAAPRDESPKATASLRPVTSCKCGSH
ncbi:MAG: hypothetical protein JWO05_3330 [Gemmatimonadetes bacterium]|nr:hypothetical protein [Gemmatimonadota bacterium]